MLKPINTLPEEYTNGQKPFLGMNQHGTVAQVNFQFWNGGPPHRKRRWAVCKTELGNFGFISDYWMPMPEVLKEENVPALEVI